MDNIHLFESSEFPEKSSDSPAFNSEGRVIISAVLSSRGSLSSISMSGSSSVSGSSLAAASLASSLAACLSTSSHVRGCTGEKVGHLDWTGVGVSSLSKNPPVVSLSVSSVVESDGGRRVWWGAEIRK